MQCRMPARNGWKNLDKQLIKRVVSNVVDFDMHYLFEPDTWVENMEEAAEGSHQVLPDKTLKERSYGAMPLMIKPEYRGDFLKRLRERLKNRDAASSFNIYDFSMPSEMLKHQEEPQPDDRTHGYIERHRPGDGAGMGTIQDYYDRGWDPTDAPEMSEDKLLRMKEAPPGRPWSPPLRKRFKVPEEILRSARKVTGAFLERQGCSCGHGHGHGPDPSSVVASHLMQVFPVDIEIDLRTPKVAISLDELSKSEYYSDGQNRYVPVNTSGVSAHIVKADPRRGVWTFRAQPQTPTGNPKRLPDPYTVVFQAIPSGPTKDVNKLQVRCTCTCPSWLWYGAQFNAYMDDYLYGPLRPKFLPPRRRDPSRNFLCCKHVVACIPLLADKKIQLPKSMRERVRRRVKPKTEVMKPEKPEKIKIPQHLKHVEDNPEIQKLVDEWDTKSAIGKRKAIFKMDDPDKIAYMAHKFPESATAYVAERLREIMKTSKNVRDAKEAEENLEEIV